MTNDIDLKLSKCNLSPCHEYTAVSNTAIKKDGKYISAVGANNKLIPVSTNESFNNAIPDYLSSEAQELNQYSTLPLEKLSTDNAECNNCCRRIASAQWYENARKAYTQAVQNERNENLCGDKNVQYPTIYKKNGFSSSAFPLLANSIKRPHLKKCSFGPTPKYVLPNDITPVVQLCGSNEFSQPLGKIVKKKPGPNGSPYSIFVGSVKSKRNSGFSISKTRNLNFSTLL